MDPKTLGALIKRTRETRANFSQTQLGERIGVGRDSIIDIEKGRRKVGIVEMLGIAEALGKPLAYFIAPEVPAVVSRRSEGSRAHASTATLNDQLRSFSSDVADLLERGILHGKQRREMLQRVPTSHADAETRASHVREQAGLSPTEPVGDVGEFAEHFGMVTFAADLGDGGPDGAVVEVGEDGNQLGAAVINGRDLPGRRRMTVVHELGHWLTGDAYDRNASLDSERMLNSFAIHLLAPRAGVCGVWNARTDLGRRDRAICVAATFKVSWSAAISQLRNLDLIDEESRRQLSKPTPVRGEFAKLGHSLEHQPACPWLSAGFKAQALKGFTSSRLTPERTLEILRGTFEEDDLPPQEDTTMVDLAAMFASNRG